VEKYKIAMKAAIGDSLKANEKNPTFLGPDLP
jgi:hypothetical protein